MPAHPLYFRILDHGYLRFVEDWGYGDVKQSEAGIIEAARQSTQGSFRGWEEDEWLLRFLYSGKPQHATPFEFAGMTIEVQAPIMVFREWQRHRIQSYAETGFNDIDDMAFNEMSARYAPLPDFNYIPTVERLMRDPGKNKQAQGVKGAEKLTEEKAIQFQKALQVNYTNSQNIYEESLANGVPKELARLVLPVGRYSRMRATTNLRNWLAFMTLRADPQAQWEIQQYAHAVGTILEHRFPHTWRLYLQGRS